MISALVVDDQVNVVSAILSGVKWHEIGIAKVYKAYNAIEAKEIIAQHKIDVMLCDIEMPGENGLSLLRWTVEQNKSIECVFLTSHADFHYAKEALLLGSFDYILQPARYDDIQNVLQKAVQKSLERAHLDTYYAYGQLIQEEKGVLHDLLIGNLLQNKKINENALQEAFSRLKIPLKVEKPFYFALVQVQEILHTMQNNDKNFRYGLDNIISELAKRYNLEMLMLKYDESSYIVFFYQEIGRTITYFDNYCALLENIVVTCQSSYKTKLAIYAHKVVEIKHLHEQMERMLQASQENGIGSVGVFLENGVKSIVQKAIVQIPEYRWRFYGEVENFPIAKQELKEWLYRAVQNNSVSLNDLEVFHQQFVQMVFRLLDKQGVSLIEFIPNPKEREAFFKVERDVHLYIQVLEELQKRYILQPNKNAVEENQLERVIHFIYQNLEKDIRRVDIAMATNLSADYISHMFRDKMNLSLSDFITTEKMKLAKSLLVSTTLPVGVIAAKVGYSNFSHFSKTYKEIYGLSPASSRKEQETTS